MFVKVSAVVLNDADWKGMFPSFSSTPSPCATTRSDVLVLSQLSPGWAEWIASRDTMYLERSFKEARTQSHARSASALLYSSIEPLRGLW